MRNQNWVNPKSLRAASFLVSGALMDNNLVMYDVETQTTWPQLLAMGNSGVREGDCLEYGRNNVATTWEFWRRLHPETVVISNQNSDRTAIKPEFYYTNPYDVYHAGHIDPPNEISRPDDRLGIQEIVLGVHAAGGKAAVLMNGRVGMATIGNTSAVFFRDPDSDTIFAFENALDGVPRVFGAHDPDENGIPRFKDTRDGTVWSIDGIALEGPQTGRRLAQLPALRLYWFAWATFFPGTPIIHL